MSIGQYVDTYWPVNRWAGQYPILAYTTWRDLNQSQSHSSVRGITIVVIISSRKSANIDALKTFMSAFTVQQIKVSKYVSKMWIYRAHNVENNL